MSDVPEQPIVASLDSEARAALLLSLVPKVGPQIAGVLLQHFGSATSVVDAPPSELRMVPGVGPTLANEIARSTTTIDIEAEIARCREQHIDIIPLSDERYPKNLREIPDPPQILYVQGSIVPSDMLSISIVGTRHATPYGRKIAGRLASSLTRAGLTVISGMARGIDAAAHRGCLEAGGRTLAVLPAGLTNIYPSEHRELAFDISKSGALISESPSTAPISRGTFPRRNRIVTGLSLGVIVIEAADRSGALISARHAAEQGREVFAVPGPIDSRVSRGCHQLIRDGAKLVEHVDHVLEELGPLVEATSRDSGESVHHPAELQLNEQEQAVLSQVESTPTSIDLIISITGLPVPRVLATISALELRRLVRRTAGNKVMRL